MKETINLLEIEELFEYLPDIYFFIKNKDYQLIMANKANVELLGYKSLNELYGKTVFDIFPRKIADDMHLDDVEVIENGNKIIDKVELVTNLMGGLSWFSTTKIPLLNNKGKVVGLKGITRNVSEAVGVSHIYNEFHPVIEYIHSRLNTNITTRELADIACLSESQFRRRFKILFRQNPTDFILKLKMQIACRYLSTTDLGISEIINKCGFNSQSHFGKKFKVLIGVTPLDYRRKYFK